MKSIVASHDLWPTPELASKVLDIMLSCDDDFQVRVSSSLRPASAVEEMAQRIGDRIGRVVTGVPTIIGSGKSGTYLRDNVMVERSNHVYAFFIDGQMSGGTGHVAQAAIDRGIPLTAYKLDPMGHIMEIGDSSV